MEFHKKKVLVVGLGKSGAASARWLSKKGAVVTITDMKAASALQENVLKEFLDLGIRLETGGHKEETFTQADIIVVSPGVPLTIEPIQAAQEKHIPIIGEMALAVAQVDTPIVAVSGTNGKSTVVTIIGDMLRASGAHVFVGGNIGNPVMEYVISGQKADYAVLEVSSFQLDTMDRFSPKVSVLLNISPDHLDRYTDYEAYVQSKLRICRDQGRDQYVVLNDDDPRLSRFTPQGDVSVLRYGLEETAIRHAFLQKNKLVIRMPGQDTVDVSLDQYTLPGSHNVENLMAAVLATSTIGPASGTFASGTFASGAFASGALKQGIRDAIDHFKGLPHRMEPVGRIQDVIFINDSKATNVDATIRAILGLNQPIILIAGGRHKGADYAPLVTVAQERVKKAVLMGEAKGLMADAFKEKVPFIMAESMDDAVSKAVASAAPGNVVLLAPACSSFDMFTDYTDRGDRFKQAIERLGHGRS
jgi:UDP-N-acetylmuramoylalanine--D-glutamate ligase